MANSLPAHISGWDERGEYFIITDVPAFTEQLPRFFRHSNFKSFVRQLNYYGFRKLRVEDGNRKTAVAQCTFHHEFFKRGHPELLKMIKPKQPTATATATNTVDPASSQAALVQQLTDHVQSLQGQVDNLTTQLAKLTSIVHELVSNGLGLPQGSDNNAALTKLLAGSLVPDSATTSSSSFSPSLSLAVPQPPSSPQTTTLPHHPRKRGRPRSLDRSRSPPLAAPHRRVIAPTVPPVVATPATASSSGAPLASAVCVPATEGWPPNTAVLDEDAPDLDELPTAMPTLADQVLSLSLNDFDPGSGGSGLLGYSSGSDEDILPDVDYASLFDKETIKVERELERTSSFEILQELLPMPPPPNELQLTRSASVDADSTEPTVAQHQHTRPFVRHRMPPCGEEPAPPHRVGPMPVVPGAGESAWPPAA